MLLGISPELIFLKYCHLGTLTCVLDPMLFRRAIDDLDSLERVGQHEKDLPES